MNNDTFQWTPELIIEFAGSPERPNHESLERFIQSKRRIVVSIEQFNADNISGLQASTVTHTFSTGTRMLASTDMSKIKAAIERVLNEEPKIDLSVPPYANDLLKMYEVHTNKELQQAEERAFNAARERVPSFPANQKYDTFQDYINHQRDKK